MSDNDAILNAAGITLAPGQSPDEIIQKILRDSYVGVKAMEVLIARHAADGIANMVPLEIEHLRTRVVIRPAPQKPKVEWALVQPEATFSGKMLIRATCGAETIQWSGDVRELRTLKFRGESVPADIAQVYEYHCGGPEDPELAAARRDWESLQAANKKQDAFEQKQKRGPQF